MNFLSKFFLFTAFIFYLAIPVWSQELMIYPAKGQSQDQMEKDKFECYSWAKGQTGFDPMQMPTATSPPPSQQKKSVGGSTLKGGLAGGAGGAIIGGIAGGSKGARKGAAIGGLSGGTIGGVRSSQQNRQTEQQRKQWEQQQANQYMQQRNEYNRAHAACLEGRGYTVK
jgi:predicted lipid-binding transport protein (Tim44 family)